MTHSIIQADAIDFLRAQPAGSLDLVFGSPPYEQARLYLEGGVNMGISRKTDAWVAWMVEVYKAAAVACKGLVAFVVAGQTRNYRWSAGPALLTAELHRAGLNLRNPPIFHRIGIFGSGGPDWLRADYEWVVCTSRPGRLPWSDNTACGKPPKYAPGGAPSHRIRDGQRVNSKRPAAAGREKKVATAMADQSPLPKGSRLHTKDNGRGKMRTQLYIPPEIANPGNVVHCIVGGGRMGGDEFAAQNEAPFPEKLAAFFVLSFCPPGGTVCDPFSGSGTTAAVAKANGRAFAGCDLRPSQVQIGLKRLATVTPGLFTQEGERNGPGQDQCPGPNRERPATGEG